MMLEFCRLWFLFHLFPPAYNKLENLSQAASLLLDPNQDCMGLDENHSLLLQRCETNLL